ncbi:MAG: hypothetical protein IJU70_06485 [Lentisphaeria bacterium]|nr:hypothetical protein [Lentisphaeria bacterium]
MINSDTSKAGPYVADGGQRVFPFGFRVLDPTHITVYANDSPVPEGDYSVNLTDDGGNVNFVRAPAAGDMIAIIRNVPPTQETDLQDNTAFLPQVIEDALDKLTMLVQQMKETLTRTLTVPPTREIKQNTLFEDFERLAENAGDWAKTAQESAEAAQTSAQQAADSEEGALTSKNTAGSYSQQAVTAARGAQMSATSAGNSLSAIRMLADLAELNGASLCFGSWSSDPAALISFNTWTPVSDITSIPARIAEHDAAEGAHAAAIAVHNGSEDAHPDGDGVGLIPRLRNRGVYQQAATLPADVTVYSVEWLLNNTGTYRVPTSLYGGPEPDDGGFAILRVVSFVDAGTDRITLRWQNCQTGKMFTRIWNYPDWSEWEPVLRESDLTSGMIRPLAGTRHWSASVNVGLGEITINLPSDFGEEDLETARVEIRTRYRGGDGDIYTSHEYSAGDCATIWDGYHQTPKAILSKADGVYQARAVVYGGINMLTKTSLIHYLLPVASYPYWDFEFNVWY